MVTKLALAHPQVAIELISHEETLLKSTGEADRIVEQILGETFKKEMRSIEFATEEFTIRGLVSTPNNSRSNRTGQYLFINQRPIHSPLVSKAVQLAFSTRLSSGQYPLFVLWITLPPHFIDINVHPQKSEVRFRNEEKMIEMVLEALGTHFGTIHAFESFQEKKNFSEAPLTFHEPALHYQINLTTTMSTPPHQQEIILLAKFDRYALVRFEKGISLFEDHEAEETIAFVDLSAMQGRLFFDGMIKAMENNEGAHKQQLLFSETLSFSPAEAEEVREKLSLLNQMGIGIREFGKCTFVIEAISEQISLADVKAIIQETSPKMERETVAKKLVSFYRCRPDLSEREIVSMIKTLLKTTDPRYSPSGKRILSHFTYKEWEQWIERSP